MTLTVNGMDITPYIAYGGVKVSRNDVDGTNAGRNIEGTMIRDLLATKRKIEVTCVPIKESVLKEILARIDGESFSVTYDDVQYGTVTKTMYSNNYSWTYMRKMDGANWYNDFSFPLIEI